MKKIYIFLIVIIFILFSCDNSQNTTNSTSNTSTNFVIPYGFIGAFGEGYAESEGLSEEIARKEALKKISEQIFVEVKSDTTLYETLNQVTKDEKIKEEVETKLESVVKTTTNIELVNVDFTLVDKKYKNGKYYTKVLGLIDKETALNTYKVYFAVKLGQVLLKDKMIFSAQKLVEEYSELLEKKREKLPANMFSELSKIVSNIKLEWRKVNNIYNQLSEKNVSNIVEALKLLESIDRIKDIARDFPNEKLVTLQNKAKPFIKDINIKIEGPNKVSVGMRIDLIVKLTPKVDSIVLKVNSKNANFPNSISLKDGEGQISGIVKDTEMEVEFSLGGLLSKKFVPGTVQESGISSQDIGKIIRIAVEGVDIDRNKAIEKGLTLAVKKAVGILFSEDVNLLLSLPVDSELIDALMGVLQYEIVNEALKNGSYHLVMNVSFKKEEFKKLLKEVIENKPTGYAVLVVNNDEYGYIEPYFEEKLINLGINLVSKEYSKKLVGYNNPSVLSKLALLSAAKYVINVKVSYGEKYLQDYDLWSVRILLSVQLIDTFTGKILKSLTFEETRAGATKQSALSKVLNSDKFNIFIENLVGMLKSNEGKINEKISLVFKVSRSTFVLVLKDYLKEIFESVTLIRKTDNEGFFIIQTDKSIDNVIDKILMFKNLEINVLQVKNNEVIFEVK
ncbi:hypothetical protein SU69_02335 [Thermosipho melanesiensis]|uniref:Lipoprotein n=2 Tax=Thermosipho melanesiensis TaxID=46541 RepID=A6LK66_THEM4|nr:LPP20 family lipoprotein [Thermosipho melanesiensis]ABR30317.1 hypothetical protein Tmel_0450 [Thermosipho melanesiensis BI429]APT73486.1 hypothetical protein BW47_02440 [Thermosipho melanesiensis]OOC37438.1 hypothetical protein SU68_02345 [Thermosipho melanesiensis]OOC39800.1 hypothetical protein SU69_02335 [Thermosipho melanesiensis]OOC39905.1 hypothetical protein SU70_02330 [Thermosipho melanesiensis]